MSPQPVSTCFIILHVARNRHPEKALEWPQGTATSPVQRMNSVQVGARLEDTESKTPKAGTHHVLQMNNTCVWKAKERNRIDFIYHLRNPSGDFAVFVPTTLGSVELRVLVPQTVHFHPGI